MSANREIQAEYVIWRESAMENVEIAPRGAQREISAYEARGFFTSAEAEMVWEMDNRKRAFEAKMKSWKRALEMYEAGELQ